VKWRLGAYRSSTIGSQHLDRDCSHGWQILVRKKQVPFTLHDKAVEREGGKGHGKEWGGEGVEASLLL